MEKSET